MSKMLVGHEDYLITNKMFVKIMQQKHKDICDILNELFNHSEHDFWHRKI